jgi:hypothetical protein
LIAQEVKSAEYRRKASSTYTTRASTRSMVIHMLRGREACTVGVVIHKADIQLRGCRGAHQRALMCAQVIQ